MDTIQRRNKILEEGQIKCSFCDNPAIKTYYKKDDNPEPEQSDPDTKQYFCCQEHTPRSWFVWCILCGRGVMEMPKK